MKNIAIIPARYGSSRFPGKPLAIINGVSMIQRVYLQVCKSEAISDVVVATDDHRIEEHVKNFGGRVLLTSISHNSGTDRCLEAANILKETLGLNENDIIINVQGDEPYINPAQIDQIIDCFKNVDVKIATLIKQISSSEELFNPNVVKCIITNQKKAIYFSRNPIPYIRNKTKVDWLNSYTFYKHIGIYAYYYKVLQNIVKLVQSPLEIAESLEQLRWLENNYSIYTDVTNFESIAIDTPDDINRL